MIKPTVGRVVWYYKDGLPLDVNIQPRAALIAYVWGDRMVNLGGFDQNGVPFNATSVTLLQEGDDPSFPTQPVAVWMPYQVGQAKKHEVAA